ncbi:FAD/NAD(P)-binding domain-containing protein [Phlegmacium glaucopus]|nr:FAD/NAD(P)-binding domain-containing protein [Phlegmacium glaucopus]
MHAEKAYDVVIVGGGPAGCATALAFHHARDNGSFLLLDNANPASFKIGESLPAEAGPILHCLSPTISTRLAHDTTCGVHLNITGNASVWESSELRETFALMNPFGMGWHLDRASFDESLRDAVRSVCAGTETGDTPLPLDPSSKVLRAKFLGVERDTEGWIISVEDLETNEQRKYRSKWMVDASGRKACLARRLGAKTLKNDALLAFYTLFTSSMPDEDHRTLIEATETGWWYTSKLSNNTRIVVYHTDDTNPSSKQARRREGFLDLLHTDTLHISQIIEGNDYRPHPDSNFPRCTAACTSYLEPALDENACWTAVGDAAMAFDPLSSQGMITALRTGSSVGKLIGSRLNSADSKGPFAASDSIGELFLRVREDYEMKKKYFYRQARFDGDFWIARR